MRKQQESLQTRKQIEKNPRALHIQSFKINFATIGCQNKEKIYKVEEKVTILVRSFEDQLNQVTGNDHEPEFPESLVSDSKHRVSRFRTRLSLGIGGKGKK